MQESLAIDIAPAQPAIGPHRDDRFSVKWPFLGSFWFSWTKQRTAILALKMGGINWMEAVTGERPILLLRVKWWQIGWNSDAPPPDRHWKPRKLS
ncbi:MAG: hypothetical protein IPJ90_03405 [Anaerolineaceae bacterium]|nr:hypothetical protein [Anaerolineaceae bacterium]